MNLRTALLAATVLALPVAATAQPVAGPYVGLGLGANFMPSAEHASTITGFGPTGTPVTVGTTTNNANINLSAGFAGLGSAGWGFGNGLRAEVEGDFMENRFTGSQQNAFTTGNEKKYGVMVNALYDFQVTPIIAPYVGVGVGYQWAAITNGQFGSSFAPNFTTNGDNAGSFAYQAILGVGFNVPPIPGLALTLEYRFMGLTGDRSYGGNINVPPAGRVPGATIPASVTLNHDFNNMVLVGLRYAFNAAPPPPPPAPPPAPVPAAVSRNYLVFFDWDRADLTDRARQIIAEAAANSKKVAVTHIQVNGYTDTSGTPKYNQGLSVRRGQSVAAELVKDGVPRTEISIQGFGETHLLVPTGPGVREPQNRRVEIILQ
jgi:OmpA-OmpF porin, OOP family